MYKQGVPAQIWSAQEGRGHSHPWVRAEIRPTPEPEAGRAGLEELLTIERERCLRLAAELGNHKERMARDVDRLASSRKEALVRDILQAIQSLERVLATRPGAELRSGIRMVHEQFLEIMKRHGVEPGKNQGILLDSNVPEAVALDQNETQSDNSMIETRGTEVFRSEKVMINNLNTVQTHVS